LAPGELKPSHFELGLEVSPHHGAIWPVVFPSVSRGAEVLEKYLFFIDIFLKRLIVQFELSAEWELVHPLFLPTETLPYEADPVNGHSFPAGPYLFHSGRRCDYLALPETYFFP
jgi:hypothetical protein